MCNAWCLLVDASKGDRQSAIKDALRRNGDAGGELV